MAKPTKAQLKAAYQATFESSTGRLVLAHLCETVGKFDKSAFVAGQPDQTNFNMGSQYVVDCILRFIYRDMKQAAQAHHAFNNENDQLPKV
jgi:hypothetical protein